MSKSPLKWRVDCNMGNYWEPIAAFNCESIAVKYAKQCADGAPLSWTYRVVGPRNKIVW